MKKNSYMELPAPLSPQSESARLYTMSLDIIPEGDGKQAIVKTFSFEKATGMGTFEDYLARGVA